MSTSPSPSQLIITAITHPKQWNIGNCPDFHFEVSVDLDRRGLKKGMMCVCPTSSTIRYTMDKKGEHAIEVAYSRIKGFAVGDSDRSFLLRMSGDSAATADLISLVEHRVENQRDRDVMLRFLAGQLARDDSLCVEYGGLLPPMPILQGPFKKKGTFKATARYLVLQPGKLLIFRNQASFESHHPSPHNVISLSEVTLDISHEATLLTVKKPGREYGLEFLNQQERDAWAMAVEVVAAVYKDPHLLDKMGEKIQTQSKIVEEEGGEQQAQSVGEGDVNTTTVDDIAYSPSADDDALPEDAPSKPALTKAATLPTSDPGARDREMSTLAQARTRSRAISSNTQQSPQRASSQGTTPTLLEEPTSSSPLPAPSSITGGALTSLTVMLKAGAGASESTEPFGMIDLESDPAHTLLSALRAQIDDELDELAEWTFLQQEVPVSKKQEAKKFVSGIISNGNQIYIKLMSKTAAGGAAEVPVAPPIAPPMAPPMAPALTPSPRTPSAASPRPAAAASPRPAAMDNDALLASIRSGKVLRKVDRTAPSPTAKDSPAAGGGFDLMKQLSMAMAGRRDHLREGPVMATTTGRVAPPESDSDSDDDDTAWD